MASLVDYSSESESDSETSPQITQIGKRSRSDSSLPPLPTAFKHIRTDDNSEKYQGRIRTVPHTEGQWPTHVYIEVPCSKEINDITAHINGSPINVDCPDDKCHISLSKCLYLKEFQHDTFVAQIKKGIKLIKPFSLSFAAITSLTNEVNTRSFCSLEVGYGYNELEKCMAVIDTVAERHRQPKFYQPPRFHASIAWSLTLESIEKAIASIPVEKESNLRTAQFYVTRLFVKIGKKISKIDLQGK
ncbi:U6 snRNA phosphodiesterase Usb1 [Umbelopsis sp. AD052]|nr:U6 snRNA phosphodiesterase Usb1 [Umbelopsis sp. AD052]